VKQKALSRRSLLLGSFQPRTQTGHRLLSIQFVTIGARQRST